MSSFPSDEHFDQCVELNKQARGAVDWKDLPTNVVYRVQPAVIAVENGSKVLLHLVNRENEEIKVWILQSIISELKEMGMEKKEDITYIKSLGEKERKVGERKRKYFDYETVIMKPQQQQQLRRKRTRLNKVKQASCKDTDEKALLEEQQQQQKTSQQQQQQQQQQKWQARKKRSTPSIPLLEDEAEISAKKYKANMERILDGTGVVIE